MLSFEHTLHALACNDVCLILFLPYAQLTAENKLEIDEFIELQSSERLSNVLGVP